MDNEKIEVFSPEDFTELETQLRESLKHVAAPEGFEDRVMARIGQRQAGRAQRTATPVRSWMSRAHRSPSWWPAVAAMLLLAAGGDVAYLHHERQQQREREAAQVQQQMDLAMELTSHALDKVQDGLDRSSAGRYTQVLMDIGK